MIKPKIYKERERDYIIKKNILTKEIVEKKKEETLQLNEVKIISL